MNSIGENYVMSMTPAIQADFWIGLWDNGLNRYDAATQTFKKYTITTDKKVDLKDFPIVTLLETQIGHQRMLWVGTSGNGVYLLEYFSEKDEKFPLMCKKFGGYIILFPSFHVF